ncbi:creatininase family protein [Lichenicoccus sp.]|uniref:creatininase family protein n=1 Tax=Lichenicoccus sp. TaxID=2781899 RepID=UPI003D0EBF3D
MRISEMNWMQVEDYLRTDDRCVVPLGSTEQHAQLSLSVDSILSERVALDATATLPVPVFPVLAFGVTPYFASFPGTVTLRAETYLRIVQDVLESLFRTGFRRILLCNGHGGNASAANTIQEWVAEHPGCRVRLHNWWNAPKTMQKVLQVDPVASHASWMENFPWTRLGNLRGPAEAKPMTDLDRMRLLSPPEVKDMLGDGNFGGLYQRSDEDMLAIWAVAVEETRALLESGWA